MRRNIIPNRTRAGQQNTEQDTTNRGLILYQDDVGESDDYEEDDDDFLAENADTATKEIHSRVTSSRQPSSADDADDIDAMEDPDDADYAAVPSGKEDAPDETDNGLVNDVEYVDVDSLLNDSATPDSTGSRKDTSRQNADAASQPKPARKNTRRLEPGRKDKEGSESGRKSSRKSRSHTVTSSTGERLHNPAFWVHIILPFAIIAIALVAFIRYQIWARGTTIQIDAGNESRFNVEVNDEMVQLPPSRRAGAADDGVTTILCLGDAPFSDDTTDTGLAGQISALANEEADTGATDSNGSVIQPVEVINASIPDSQVACYNASYKTDTQHDMEDAFNLFYIAYAISIDDYSSQETVATLHTDDPQYAAALEALKNTDFSKVDVIAIMYDGIDYVNQSPAYNPDLPVSEQINTYQGALSNAFTLIQEKYPYIRIVFMSPAYMLLEDANGNLQDARTENIGNGTLAQYWQYGMDVCGDCGVSFLDNYYGSINDSNYTEYLSDNMHLNNAGRTKVADHFVYKVINNEYAEYDVGSLAIAKQQ